MEIAESISEMLETNQQEQTPVKEVLAKVIEESELEGDPDNQEESKQQQVNQNVGDEHEDDKESSGIDSTSITLLFQSLEKVETVLKSV